MKMGSERWASEEAFVSTHVCYGRSGKCLLAAREATATGVDKACVKQLSRRMLAPTSFVVRDGMGTLCSAAMPCRFHPRRSDPKLCSRLGAASRDLRV